MAAVLCLLQPVAMSAASAPPEPYRPGYHFSPAKNWLNDPNGLVYAGGKYHLFFQYNPEGDQWGNMSWGHATSKDLVSWQEQPVAIPYDANEGVFSGSAVVDTHNTSGFGTETNPPLVAVYTSAYTRASGRDGIQAQSLAYSTDNGQTWTKYANNPVLDLNSREFRDPKVFWHEPSRDWRMVVALPTQHKVSIYSSPNLKDWTHLSDFGGRGAQSGIWECPDLFPLPVDGDPTRQKWVLLVSLNPGSIAGGSGTQYFVGDFDGTRFTADGDGSYTPPAGLVLQDFESGYAGWSPSGEAFGSQPATGALPGQQEVSGHLGSKLVNSFVDGDRTTGTLTSPEFTVDQRYLSFLVGGGRHPYEEGRSTRGVDPVGDVLADFEQTPWDGWTATGGLAAGESATGALAGQRPVREWRGSRFVNTFLDGDATTGTLTSPTFTISRSKLNLLVGGGKHPWGDPSGAAAVVLKVDGQVVRSATGTDSETLAWQTWDVADLVGKQAQVEVVDANTGPFGHVLLDQVTASEDGLTTFADFEGHTTALPAGWTGEGEFAAYGTSEPNLPGQQGFRVIDTCVVPDRCDAATGKFVSPEFTVREDYVSFLLAGGRHPWSQSSPTSVNLVVDGQVVRTATGPHSGEMDWTSFDVRDLAGKEARVEIVDQNAGGDWGHLMVDSFVFTSRPADKRANATAVNLLADGKVVRTATGQDSEHLDWVSWDLADLQGKKVQLQVVDQSSGGWGHILADHFLLAAAPAQSEVQRASWVDFGRDNYAGVTFNNVPDGRRIAIGWMSNWQYAGALPTSPWRGQMTLPRELRLVSSPDGPRLAQQAVGELATRFDAKRKQHTGGKSAAPLTFDGTAVVDVQVSTGAASEAGVEIRSGDGTHVTRVTVQTDPARVVVDRTRSGAVDFNALFPSVESAPLDAATTKLRIFVDNSSIEVFAQDGQRVITDMVFPAGGTRSVTLVSGGGTPDQLRASVTPIRP